jgi:hypothetical protein
MTQVKLTKEQIGKLKQARNGIENGVFWAQTDEGHNYWQKVSELLDAKIKHGTSDGKPWVDPDPPLTDEDACVWPRRWVMVRDDESEPWRGPYRYLGKNDDYPHPFVVDSGKDGGRIWEQARRATPKEIEAAK